MAALALAAAVPADAGWSIPVGCPVLDVAGEKVGTVAGASADALVVGRALFFEDRVPYSAVADFDGHAVRLKVTKAAVRRGEWDPAGRR